MRKILFALLLPTAINLPAQELLFNKTISENQVPQAARLGIDLKSHYFSTRYVSQVDFLLPQDFFIAITPELIVRSRFIKIHQHPTGSFSYEGKLEGPVSGEISFSKFNDRTAGMIVLADGKKYMIDQTAPGIFAISLSVDNIFIQRDASDDFIEVEGDSQPNLAATSICDINSTCPSSSIIDIMVVYTAQAAANWGGVSNTVANITQAVTNMTTSMTNSGINNVTFRLVHTEQVSYTESGSFSTDLSRLAGTTDGYMDNVHALRDQYGADLVCLIIGSPTSSCGIGYLNTSPTSYSASLGFNVSLYSCVVGNYTMAHECGHTMGLRHDWYVDASTTPCSHHHGYVNQTAVSQGTSSPSSARWRTIMAYNNQCSNAGINCTRLNRWSNPLLTYNGDPTGIAIGNTQPSDEAYAFYRMACRVAEFRPEATTCPQPTGLTATNITTSSATLGWNAASGATSYDADYKLSSSSTWINAATTTTSTSVNISGLSSASVYDWRVKTNCSGESSNYATSQFTTQSPPTCNSPAGLTSSSITSSSATISWNSVGGALNYDVDYKAASSATWINAAAGTTSLSVNISGLTASTLYDWRVRANCSSLSSNYSQAQFTTSAPAAPCPGPYDISTNDNISGAALIPLNTDIKGTIAPRNDNDYYRFTITTGGTITVSLTTLPANYQLALLNAAGTQIGISQNNGTANETINATVAAGDYYARVFPKGGASNATDCYTLIVQTGTASDAITGKNMMVKLYPNPAASQVYVWIEGIKEKAEIRIYNMLGKLLVQQRAANNMQVMDISKLPAGLYLLRVNEGTEMKTVKFVKE